MKDFDSNFNQVVIPTSDNIPAIAKWWADNYGTCSLAIAVILQTYGISAAKKVAEVLIVPDLSKHKNLDKHFTKLVGHVIELDKAISIYKMLFIMAKAMREGSSIRVISSIIKHLMKIGLSKNKIKSSLNFIPVNESIKEKTIFLIDIIPVSRVYDILCKRAEKKKALLMDEVLDNSL